MKYVELGLVLIGVLLLVIGYRKNNRNILFVAAIAMFVSGSIGDFAHGFANGYLDGSASTSSSMSK